MSFCYQPSAICIHYYFDKRRSLASGIAHAGTGLGIFGVGPLWRWLMDLYGWRGMLLVYGRIMLNCAALGALHRPLHIKQNMQNVQDKKTDEKQVCSTLRAEMLKTWRELVDPHLLRQPMFLWYLAATFTVTFSHMAPLQYLVDRAQNHGIEVL